MVAPGPYLEFQSSPSPKAGSYLQWMAKYMEWLQFQSSPSPKAGSYARPQGYGAALPRFNPLPARRPGATPFDNLCVSRDKFQSSPSPKAGSYTSPNTNHHVVDVSILSQPEGRELLLPAGALLIHIRFQSSPSPKAGSYQGPKDTGPRFLGFNPLPARRPGATSYYRGKLYESRFQSSPSPKAGSYQ